MTSLLVRLTSTTTGRARICASRPAASRSKAILTPWPMRRAPAISIAWPDVKGEVGGRNEAEPEFARVQRDRHVAGEKADDLHLAGIVAARHQVVFGPDEIEPDQPRFGPNQRHRGGCLNEDVIRRIVAIDLHDVAEGDAAAGLRRGRVAAQLGCRWRTPDRCVSAQRNRRARSLPAPPAWRHPPSLRRSPARTSHARSGTTPRP